MADTRPNIHVISITLSGSSPTQRELVADRIGRYARSAVKRHGIKIDVAQDSEWDSITALRSAVSPPRGEA